MSLCTWEMKAWLSCPGMHLWCEFMRAEIKSLVSDPNEAVSQERRLELHLSGWISARFPPSVDLCIILFRVSPEQLESVRRPSLIDLTCRTRLRRDLLQKEFWAPARRVNRSRSSPQTGLTNPTRSRGMSDQFPLPSRCSWLLPATPPGRWSSPTCSYRRFDQILTQILAHGYS